ncbi:class D sortase [Sporosarcina trichiuri]|uniref:class D sortase n=1 Tax=Sporosarcina trichiuri TaxID=3056445 RepID=UPI0025B5CCDD|nr:class D sortase [Sporosarcina sp. 0.2-SM1T-5]WJY26219.1 class D sortase [Sporosarcina sp. 0.2-SM1T-5]
MKHAARWTGNILVLAGIGLLIWQFTGIRETKGVKHEQLDAFANLKAAAEESGQATKEAAAAGGQQTGKQAAEKKIGDIEGVLDIPQIDIHAPVAYGATPEILDRGFGAIPRMDMPGETGGSYAIAGHQSHVFGQFFNRLDELAAGNRFSFETVDEEQTYEVYDMQIVDPEDVEVIGREQGKAKLSLITCYPKNSDKHRLVVMAKRVDGEAGE